MAGEKKRSAFAIRPQTGHALLVHGTAAYSAWLIRCLPRSSRRWSSAALPLRSPARTARPAPTRRAPAARSATATAARPGLRELQQLGCERLRRAGAMGSGNGQPATDERREGLRQAVRLGVATAAASSVQGRRQQRGRPEGVAGGRDRPTAGPARGQLLCRCQEEGLLLKRRQVSVLQDLRWLQDEGLRRKQLWLLRQLRRLRLRLRWRGRRWDVLGRTSTMGSPGSVRVLGPVVHANDGEPSATPFLLPHRRP